MKVAVIVPAYNERDRISAVLDAIKDAKTVDEIIVVCDGSTDGTYEAVASDSALKVINLEVNRGKGGAMRVGAESTDADIVLFLDADLFGMTGAKVDMLIEPVLSGRADMSIGIFKGGRGFTDLAQLVAPYITGQRAVRRDEFLKIPGVDGARSGVETVITKYYRSNNLRDERVELSGCTHAMKEEKMGFAKGLAARMKMYLDIGKILIGISMITKQ